MEMCGQRLPPSWQLLNLRLSGLRVGLDVSERKRIFYIFQNLKPKFSNPEASQYTEDAVTAQ